MSTPMTATDLTTRLAEVVGAHMYAGRVRNLGQYRTESTCECGAAILYGSNQGDLSYTEAIAAHVATQLAAVVRDAQAEALETFKHMHLNPEHDSGISGPGQQSREYYRGLLDARAGQIRASQ